jgi:hypothetical protein
VKLADLRRLAVKKHLKIHFRLRNGMECVVNSEGVAQIPELRAIPDFHLEDELSAAGEFLVEPPAPAPPKKLGRDEMISMAAASPVAAAAHDHDDE